MKPYYIIITPFFPTLLYSRQFFVYEQVKLIQEMGKYEVIIFKPKTLYSSEKDYEYDDLKVFRFNVYELPSNILPGIFDFVTAWFFRRKLKSIGIKTKDIAVVHAHVNYFGFLANVLKKSNSLIKTFVQHHGFDVLGLENGKFRNVNWHRNWVQRYGVKISNKIDIHIGVSEKTLDFLTNVPKINIKDKYVLYNGLDTKKFYPISNCKKSNFFTIGCVGIFWPLKDQITLIKATKILVDEGIKSIKVKFIGSGETLEMCRNFVTDNNLEEYFEFTDKVPHHELVHFYNSLDLFVLPSYHEAFGCVYTEAYACGVPFIGVEGQGIAELISEKDKSKWLIKKGDYIELAEKIKNFKDNRYEQHLIKSIVFEDTIEFFLKHIE